MFQGIEFAHSNRGGAVLFLQTLWQQEVPTDERKQEKASGGKKWCTVVDRCQQSTNSRANERTDTCRSTEHAEVLATVLWFRDISDIAKQDWDVAACQAIDDASEEEQPERTAKAQDEIAYRGTKETDEENGASPKTVGKHA